MSAPVHAAGEAQRRQDAPVLSVAGLSVDYRAAGSWNRIVHGVDLQVARGETVALVGQSGSGKSTVVNAVTRLLAENARVSTGEILLDGRSLLSLSAEEFRRIRTTELSYVPQDPLNSLNPVRAVGGQLLEKLRLLPEWADRNGALAETRRLLGAVGLSDHDRILAAFPHQLSGGQLQRVLIAIAIAGRPRLLIADEPTSALDVTVQKTILDLLARLTAELGTGMLLVTHDLSIAAERAARTVVLHAGRVEETGPSRRLIAAPRADYTRRLIADVPSLTPDKYRLQKPSWRYDDTAERARPVVELASIRKAFDDGVSARTVLADVSLRIRPGTTHALVGESGSGKSTLAKILLQLVKQDEGQVYIRGTEISQLGLRGLQAVRRNLQFIYQNPFSSLDPRLTVRRLVREPLTRYRVGSRGSREELVRELVAAVGLPSGSLDVRPERLSGGQRQRVAIARALVLHPEVLVLDEPTSALDVSVQAQILDLLFELQSRLGLSYLFISHDLGTVRQFADEVSVLAGGRIVEAGHVVDVLEHPRHEYTRLLVDAVPALERPGAAATVPVRQGNS